jgi:hypothetical protein
MQLYLNMPPFSGNNNNNERTTSSTTTTTTTDDSFSLLYNNVLSPDVLWTITYQTALQIATEQQQQLEESQKNKTR